MLQEGHTKEEAEKEIDLFLELVGWFETARLQLGTTENELRLAVTVSLAEITKSSTVGK
jgi:hypothetical protein